MFHEYKHDTYKYVTIVRVPFRDIEKLDFALCNQPTETPDAYYKRQSIKPDIITNGGFFAMSTGATCFSFHDEGRTISTDKYDGVGIKDAKTLFYGKGIQNLTGVRDYISAYPALVEDGKKIKSNVGSEIDYKARRTAFGWNAKYLFIVTVDAPGLRFSALADIFVELGAKFAINLDGGGSTRMLINGKRKTAVQYARPVDNVFCVYLKKPEKKEPAYRVFLGAWKPKDLDKAKAALGDLLNKGYSDLKITSEYHHYYIVLGTYEVKLNAQREMDKLKALGYKPGISRIMISK